MLRIFVLGTGRSGTHWVGHILDSHPQIRATIERRPIFRIATRAAVEPSQQDRLLPWLRLLYTYEGIRSWPRHYADKSHPAIWYADEIARWFPRSRFVAVERSPFGTVASMLRHADVERWQQEWHRYELPNPFLGIDATTADCYEGLSPAEKASLRWLSHHRQTNHLRSVLGDRMLVLNYESMVGCFHREMTRLWDFLGVHAATTSHGPNTSSQDSWKHKLNRDDIVNIERITGVPSEP